MDKWTTTMNYGSNVLKKWLVLTFLVTGTVSSGQQVSKPYKVCPEIVTAKDTPCKVATPSAAIVHRIEKEDPRDKQIKDLELRIIELEALVKQLGKDNETTR